MEKSQKARIFWTALPLIVCILVMLPRLLSPQFGMLDDGVTLTRASRIVGGDFSLNYDGDTGRYRPMYWLVPAMVYALAGENPFWFFVGNLIILMLTVGFSMAFLRKLGAPATLAGAAGILFILSGTTMENAYTLSKGEFIQLLFLVMALYNSAVLYAKDISIKNLTARTLLSTVLIVLAATGKETAVVILPIAGCWLVVELLSARWMKRAPHWRWIGSFFASSLLGFAIYWIVRNSMVSIPLESGSYTNGYTFTLEAIKASVVRWVGWLLRDDSYLLPLVLFWIIASLVKKKTFHVDGMLALLVWMGGWIAVYLPWKYAQEYYLLPFELGAAAMAAVLAWQAWKSLRGSSKTLRITAGAALVLAAVLWLVSMPNHVTDARIQLAVDSANMQMLDEMEKLPANSTVLLNIQYPNEYTTELDLMLRTVRGRKDITLKTFYPDQPLPADYILTPITTNRPLLTVRMGVSEPELTAWIESLQEYVGAGTQPVMSVERSVPLSIVDLPRIFCPLISKRAFCTVPRPLIDTRTFSYGWQLYPAP